MIKLILLKTIFSPTDLLKFCAMKSAIFRPNFSYITFDYTTKKPVSNDGFNFLLIKKLDSKLLISVSIFLLTDFI
ncbi:hypothetical protein BUI56_00735 [Lactococcus lactis subsp. lactis]|nr:hypothetical protein CVCAS_1461 [Lactococcus lactis subsp. lactis CV56]KAF0956567.1 hypothetical protein BUI56_00735 [Lactococcus lactis subsp. lactis]ONK33349.1 hypothetical protein BZO99_01470 [Lactococcus lactis subsp. lactis]PFG92137.1 hypothetical protein BW155_07650 [Lactococcus lactis subsp. lactis]